MFNLFISCISFFHKKFLVHLVPRPATGSLALDIFYLVILLGIQFNVIPSLLFFHHIDLLTIWLCYHFIVLAPAPALAMGLIAALMLENHSTVPEGTYICIYWILAIVLNLLRDHLSWRDYSPWLACFFIAGIGVFLFETIVTCVKTGDYGYFTLFIVAQKLLGITLSTLFGLALVQRHFLASGRDLT